MRVCLLCAVRVCVCVCVCGLRGAGFGLPARGPEPPPLFAPWPLYELLLYAAHDSLHMAMHMHTTHHALPQAHCGFNQPPVSSVSPEPTEGTEKAPLGLSHHCTHSGGPRTKTKL
jgi:hypothetical protein